MLKRSLAAIGVTMLVVLGASCGGDPEDPEGTPVGDEQAVATYDDNGVMFEYPGDWEEFPAELSATSAGSNELWSAAVGPDKTDLVNIIAYQLNIDITEKNVDAVEGELDGVIQGLVADAGGKITAGPSLEEVAGYPAYTYTWKGVEVNGERKDSSAYFVFVDDVEYFINCQFSDESAYEIQAGCAQILESFEVTDNS